MRNLRISFALLSLVLTPLAAQASLVIDASVDELSQLAPVVVLAQVQSQQARRLARGRVQTYVDLKISEVVKGSVPSSIRVRLPSGESDGIVTSVEGSAKFGQSESVLLFLEPAPDEANAYVVMGLSLGKVTFAVSNTGKRTAERDISGLGLYNPRNRTVRAGGRENFGDADAFVARVRSASKGGAR